MNKSTVLGVLLFVFLISYTVILALFSDQLAAMVQNSNDALFSILLYYLTQPGFLIIVIGSVMFGKRVGKITTFTVAGIILAFWQDIVSTARCVPGTGIANLPSVNFLCSDTIFIRALSEPLGFQVSYWIYYLAVPIVFVILATELVGPWGLLKWVKSQL